MSMQHQRHTPTRTPGPSPGRRRYNGLAGPSRVRRRRLGRPAAPASAAAACPSSRRPADRRGSTGEKETPTVVLTERTEACAGCPASSTSPCYILREKNGMTPTRPSRPGGRGGPAAAGRTAGGPGRALPEPPSSQESEDATAPPRPSAAAVRGGRREMTVHPRRGAASGGTQASSSAASGSGNPFGDTQPEWARENQSQQLTSATQFSRGGDGEDVDPAEKLSQVNAMIQVVLESGIASICRLRDLFPAHFYEKLELGGTSVTKFGKDKLKRIIVPASDDDDDEDDDGNGSMIKNVNPRTQQSTLSPLTMLTQRNTQRNRARRDYTDEERLQAGEALLLLKWLKMDGGVGSILREGNLAKVVFSIWVPSDDADDDGEEDELIESYEFNISCNKPRDPADVAQEEVIESTEELFKTLNGLAHRSSSFSQGIVPCNTQSTNVTQATTASSCYRSTQQSSHFTQRASSSSQFTQSQFEESRKSLIESMSQSIHASVKGNSRRRIPDSRYLTLRVHFNRPQATLPRGLEGGPAAVSFKSPVPATGRGDRSQAEAFVVTPLGTIAENGFSGLCVRMEARSRARAARDDGSPRDDASVHFSLDNREPSRRGEEGTHSLSKQSELDEPRVAEGGNDLTDTQPSTAPSQESSIYQPDPDLQVGTRAFALPSEISESLFVKCKILDFRVREGLAKEYLVKFKKRDVEKDTDREQWLRSRSIVSLKKMTENVSGELETGLLDEDDIAELCDVGVDFVRKVAAKKRCGKRKRVK